MNPDWQVPLLWQRGLSQALFKEQKSGLICNKSYAIPSWSSVDYKLQDEDDDDGDKIGSLNNDDRLVPSRYLSVFWDERRLGIRLRRARGLMGREDPPYAST